MKQSPIDLHFQPKQKLAFDSPATEILFGGAAFGGKVQPLRALISTPFGFKRMGDIAVGDQVSNPDGSVARVIAVHPQGEIDVYRVTFDDGASCEVGLDHLWQVRVAGVRRFRKKSIGDAPTRWRVTTTRELLKDYKKKSYLIPLSKPIQYTTTSRNKKVRWPIHPYFLGVCLGDAHIGKDLSLTTEDEEIISRLKSLGYYHSRIDRKQGNAAGSYCYNSRYNKIFQKLGLLGKHSWDKFIPEVYKHCDLEMRKELLCGLMDTDGYVDSRGHVSLTTVSKKLAIDVQYLAWSLGLKANITSKIPTFTYRGQKKKGREAFSVWLKGDGLSGLFYLKRKKLRADVLPKNEKGRRIVSIQFVRRDQGACITVDNPNGLYITNDFIVTHNSWFLRAISILYATFIPGVQIYLFRRHLPDLIKNHMEGPAGYRALLADWVKNKIVTIVEDEVRFWNGSKIYLCHCQDEADRFKYQGSEIHLLLVDELTTFTETIYTFLRSRVRCVGLKIPPEFKGKVPRIICGSNPGGVGHLFCRRTFIDPADALTIWKAPDDEGGMLRQFIPAKLDDNPIGLSEDPGYEGRLSGLGTPELVRAYRDGDWNIVQGAFFPEFTGLNILDPFKIPDSWPRVRGMDWGSRDPCAVGWMCVTDEDFVLDEKAPRELLNGYFNDLYHTDRRIIPKHSRIIYRDWYIADSKDRGLKLGNYELARGICERESLNEKVLYGVAGKDTFRNLGGPSIAQQLNHIANTKFSRSNLFSRQADNRRIPGWSEVRSRLIGVEGYSQLYIFSSCRDTIRLIPQLQADERKPEDVSQGHDHIGELLRYLLMSFLHPESRNQEDSQDILRQDWSLDYLWKTQDEQKGNSLI